MEGGGWGLDEIKMNMKKVTLLMRMISNTTLFLYHSNILCVVLTDGFV